MTDEYTSSASRKLTENNPIPVTRRRILALGNKN